MRGALAIELSRAKLLRLVLTLGVSVSVLLSLASSAALAANGHSFLRHLELPTSEPQPAALAVSPVSGEVFVADNAAGAIDVFSASGTRLGEFGGGLLENEATGLTGISGLAVDAAGRVYVADRTTRTIQVFRSDGFGSYTLVAEWHGYNTPAKLFSGDLSGVAVDTSTSVSDPAAGDVYVVDKATNAVYVFKPGAEETKEGAYVSTLKGKPAFEEPNAVAVSASTGTVYVADSARSRIEVFEASGAFTRAVFGKGTPNKAFARIGGISVEEAAEEKLYVADEVNQAVDEFNGLGEWVGRTNAGEKGAPIREPVAVAVQNASGASHGDLYVADADPTSAAVDLFGATVTVPAVTTGKATEIERAIGTKAIIAKLNGTINPEGQKSHYHFEYREVQTEVFHRAPAEASGDEEVTGSSPLEVHTTVQLKPETPYQFRLVGVADAAPTAGSYGLIVGFKNATPSAVTGVFTGEAESIAPTSATLTGKFSPQKIETSYHFEYGESLGYGHSTPTVNPSSSKPVSAAEAVSGLITGRTYHFRLVAQNEFGTTYGGDQSFTTTASGPPSVSSESSEVKSPTSAALNAQINANGETTSYHFEYGATEAYGQSTADTELPIAGNASAEVTGLSPNTAYHFRVDAKNGKGETQGSDATLTTSSAPAATAATLPDGRAYELVSPPEKHGGYVVPLSNGGSLIQASEDGSALAYVTIGPLVEGGELEGNRSPETQQVLATRSATSWNSQQIVTPTERPGEVRGAAVEYLTFSSNLSLAALQPLPSSFTPLAEPTLAPPAEPGERGHQEKTIYLRANQPLSPEAAQIAIYENARKNGEALAAEHGETKTRPGYLPVVTMKNTVPGAKYGGKQIGRGLVEPRLRFLDATPDLSHVVIKSEIPLTRPPALSARGLYEWAAEELQLVSILPSGQPATEGRIELGAGVAGVLPNDYRHAISENGTRIVWMQEASFAGPGWGHLYVRDVAKGETVQVDSPAPGVNSSKGEAIFQGANGDGSKIFFTDTQPLTPDSKASGGQGRTEKPRPDLYVCEVFEEAGKLACHLRDLTAPSSTGESAHVEGGVLGTSENGTYVYLVAAGVLAPGASAGANNLYGLHQEGSNWSTKFIASLSSQDAPVWTTYRQALPEPINMTARVSPNGRYLAFMSNRSLTGYNNMDVNEEEVEEELGSPLSKTTHHFDEEVFLYKAGDEASNATLTCASCNPSGARPHGVYDRAEAGEGVGLLVDRVETWQRPTGLTPTTIEVDHWLAGSIPGWTPISDQASLHQPRYLSDQGRLFFTSADALVAEVEKRFRPETIVPGHIVPVGVENVYQYEQPGLGSCTAPTGCVSLISSGKSEKESSLLDASTTGNDVFFITTAKLLPQDTDSSYDVYDARVCGEAGCQPLPPEVEPPCESIEKCHGSGPERQTFQPPFTSTFSGPGNTSHVLPTSGTLPTKTSKPATLTNAQKLALALKACRKLPHKTRSQKQKRTRCESQARKRYAPPKHKKRGKK
jgi:sugar lactone lactonase YvrE